MNDLLTVLHLAVVMLDLRIRMMQAIREGQYELAMTYHLLLLVRSDELGWDNCLAHLGGH